MKLHSTALIRSTIAVIWLIVGMTLLSEVSASFKAFLTQVGSHHWIGKGILATATFVVLYLLFRKFGESKGIFGGTLLVVGSVVLGGLIIFGFFIWNFFGA
jgi:hypothetical protein